MKTKLPTPHNQKTTPTIPHCPYEIPISTIYNPSSPEDVPVVSIYNPNIPNKRPESDREKPNFKRLCLEKLKAQFHKDHGRKLEFYAAVCFLTSLVVTGAIIVILHKSTTKDTLLVHGEFTVLNVKYSNGFSRRNSSHFRHISKDICHAVDSAFLVPGLSDFYRHCKVTAISSNMNCHVLLTFANDPSVTIGQIGLTFIRSLRILHGKTWLGGHTVNVQSIGFMISGQEGKWGEWSEWSACNSTLGVTTRTRPCLDRSGVRLTSVDRCLLIPGAKSDLDIRKCHRDSAREDAFHDGPNAPEDHAEHRTPSQHVEHAANIHRAHASKQHGQPASQQDRVTSDGGVQQADAAVDELSRNLANRFRDASSKEDIPMSDSSSATSKENVPIEDRVTGGQMGAKEDVPKVEEGASFIHPGDAVEVNETKSDSKEVDKPLPRGEASAVPPQSDEQVAQVKEIDGMMGDELREGVDRVEVKVRKERTD